MVARGSEKWGKLPDMGYIVNRKSEVWSDNVSQLYEEDKARRWTPAVDIPWSDLDANPLAPDLEAACAQLYTFLQECALVSLDFSSRWVPMVNQDFIEQKSWMCAQMLGWSRLNEAFRKRALFGGAGLKRASVPAEQGLKEWLYADIFPQGSLSINLSLGGFINVIARHVAAFAPSKVDHAIMHYAMQDTARYTAYGLGQLSYLLRHRPGEAAGIHEYPDATEHVILAIFGSPGCWSRSSSSPGRTREGAGDCRSYRDPEAYQAGDARVLSGWRRQGCAVARAEPHPAIVDRIEAAA